MRCSLCGGKLTKTYLPVIENIVQTAWECKQHGVMLEH